MRARPERVKGVQRPDHRLSNKGLGVPGIRPIRGGLRLVGIRERSHGCMTGLHRIACFVR